MYLTCIKRLNLGICF